MKCSSAFLVMAAATFAVAPLCADVMLVASPVTAPAGSSGYFDVLLTNTGSGFLVGAFSFGLSVSDPNIAFTGATSGTTVPYILQGSSMFGPDIATTFGAQELVASDVDLLGGGITVGAGATVGLGRVFFDTGAGFSSNTTVTFLSSEYTNLSDPSGNLIAIDTVTNGAIDVSATSVPEPATFWQMGLAALILLGTRLRRR